MEKVKLMKEQAEAIEHALQEVDEYKGNPDRLLRHASMNNVNFRNELHPLDTIDIVTLAKALYIGYEVETEFKVGEWVAIDYKEHGTKVGKIKGYIKKDAFYIDNNHATGNIMNTRHATPEEIAAEKERRWWAKHGRDVWELRPGDLLVSDIGVFKEVQEINNDSVTFVHENYVAMDNLKLYYKLVCFAENRLDKHNG